MKHTVSQKLAAALLACSAFMLIAWTQSTSSDWLKGIIYAGSGKIQLTDATGNLLSAGNFTSAGNVGIGGTLAVTGATTLRSTLAVSGTQTNAGALAVSGALGVTGAATLRSTLAVTGAATLSSTLGVGGALTAPTGTFTGQLIGKGTITNDSAAAGVIGEVLGPITRVQGSAVALTTATTANIASTTNIVLTAGDWEVRGIVGFLPAATTSITLLIGGVSSTSATLPATSTTGVPASGEVRVQDSRAAYVPAANPITLQIPPFRVTVASGATLTLYLVGQATFTVSTLSGFGWMEARRMR